MSLDDNKLFRNDLKVNIYSQRLRQNVANLRSLCRPETKFCAVVKANAYGHGATEVVSILRDEPVDFFAVANVFEAIHISPVIRAHQRILIFEPLNQSTSTEHLTLCAENDYHCAICGIDAAEHVAAKASEANIKLNIHINIETGMGRLGIEPVNAGKVIEIIDSSQNLKLAGVYTHFATADEDDLSFAYEQLENFKRFLAMYKLDSRKDVIIHSANSAATMKLQDSHFDMARCGIAMYGYYSRSQKKPPIDLYPVMQLQVPIVQLKRIPAGRSVSYGRSYFTKRDTVSAIVPFGYSDGYQRSFSNKAKVRIGEGFAPVIGRVCMDQIMVDVTDIPGVKVGDWVTVIDDDQKSPASAYGLADIAGTICYEILISLHRHLRRVIV
ncbi:MAG: alanine racemase [Sedimentisphaeraceae bacterium JB056]